MTQTTTQPKTIRRADYRRPDYRIETVDLAFDLVPDATRVTARLKLRADHDRKAGVRPLLLDGDALTLVSVALDGRALGAGEYAVDDKSLTIAAPPEAFTLDIETRIDPA